MQLLALINVNLLSYYHLHVIATRVLMFASNGTDVMLKEKKHQNEYGSNEKLSKEHWVDYFTL